MKGIVILQPGSIITIIAHNHESQQFQFCAKIDLITDDKIILSDVFDGALEDTNTPFTPVEPETESEPTVVIEIRVVNKT